MLAALVAHVDVGGTLAQWLTVGAAVLIAWRISRGGGGAAVQELSEANRVLERRIHELGAEVRDLKVENERLRQRTDFQGTIDGHERRANERHEAILHVLELVAERLGPDPDNGGPA